MLNHNQGNRFYRLIFSFSLMLIEYNENLSMWFYVKNTKKCIR